MYPPVRERDEVVGASGISLMTSNKIRKPLLLGCPDGPWNWREARFELLAGAPPDPHSTTFSQTVLDRLCLLGGLTAKTEGAGTENVASVYCFDGDREPLRLSGTTFDEAGTGHRVWDSALALALFLRSDAAPELPANSRVLELGAGVGLPGLELGRWTQGRARITLTDSRPALLALLRRNAAGVGLSGIDVRGFEWGSGGRVRDGVFFQRETPESGVDTAAHSRFDLVLGSEICYLPEDVSALATLLLDDLRAPLSMIIAPFTRTTFAALRDSLSAREGVQVDEVMLTLASANADAGLAGAARSCGVHRLLIVKQAVEEL